MSLLDYLSQPDVPMKDVVCPKCQKVHSEVDGEAPGYEFYAQFDDTCFECVMEEEMKNEE